jgi:hypothetical protein
MTYKIYTTIPNGYHNDLVLENVDQKPNIETVLWFSVHRNNELVSHVADKPRVARAHRGVASDKFRKIQYELFKQYYDLTDNDDVPYKHPYTKKG